MAMPKETGKMTLKEELEIWDERLLGEMSPEVAASVERLSREFKRAYEMRLKKERIRNRPKVLDAQA
jgi:hypothetical protein